jgi:hypothetical protein
MTLPKEKVMGSSARVVAAALVIGLIASLAPATITIDGDASDWAGKLMNLDATVRPGKMDVLNWGVIVDTTAGMAYFAQTVSYDMVNNFVHVKPQDSVNDGLWLNWWLDLDNDITTGFNGGEVEKVGLVDQGIDAVVELCHYKGEIKLYYNNGEDCRPYGTGQAYEGKHYIPAAGTFEFSDDGKFVECAISISDLITQAQVLLAIDSTKYGDFDVDAANTGLWRVGARVDGDDSSAGISSGISFEGMVTLPLTTGDANLDGLVDVIDLGLLATNYGGTTDVTWDLGDFNADGVIDVIDLGLLATYYGQGSLHGVQTPEPTTLGLLALGALGIIRRRRN